MIRVVTFLDKIQINIHFLTFAWDELCPRIIAFYDDYKRDTIFHIFNQIWRSLSLSSFSFFITISLDQLSSYQLQENDKVLEIWISNKNKTPNFCK